MIQQDQTTVAITESASADITGTVFDGKYKIISKLGSGGMSSVYRAKQLLLNKECALKLMHPRLVSDADALIRFNQEAKAASALSHPNIIKVFDFSSAHGQPYQAMEYLEGRSLAEEIRNHGALDPLRALHVLMQICAALDHAHKNNVIHRDLKPGNVMLAAKEDDPDYVILVDFGIAKILSADSDAQHLTQTGEILGSPFYMSPEQCLGRKLDARSDIYSMGCLMFETLAGRPPFMGETIYETVQKHQDATPPTLRAFVKDQALADQLDAILLKSMAKDPAQRYQTVFDLGADLLKIESGDNSTIAQRLRRQWEIAQLKMDDTRRRKYPFRVLVGLVVAVISLLLLTGFLSQSLLLTRVPALEPPELPKFAQAQLEDEPSLTGEMAFTEGKVRDVIAETMKRQVDQLPPEKQIERLSVMGCDYAERGQAGQAAQLFDRMRYVMANSHLEMPFKDKTQAEITYACMGDAYYYSNQPRLAARYYHLAARQYGDQADRIMRRLSLKAGDAEMRAKQYLDALADFKIAASGKPTAPFTEIAFNRPRNAEPEIDAAVYVSSIGEAAKAINDLDTAKEAYKAALREWQRCAEIFPRASNMQMFAYYSLAEIQAKQNDFASARNNMLNAIAQLDQAHDTEKRNIPALWDALAEIDRNRGDWLHYAHEWCTARLLAHQRVN